MKNCLDKGTFGETRSRKATGPRFLLAELGSKNMKDPKTAELPKGVESSV